MRRNRWLSPCREGTCGSPSRSLIHPYGSGKIYPNSVEEIVALKILNETRGEDESFHGAGREDIDVRMLGNGRPFILEVKNPKKRNINLINIQKMINKEYKDYVQVEQLRFSDNDEITRIKEADFKII